MNISDIFDNSLGRFTDYTTILGGKPSHTEVLSSNPYPAHIYSKQDLSQPLDITALTPNTLNLQNGRIYATSAYSVEKKFLFNNKDFFLDCATIIGFKTPTSSTSTFSIGSILRHNSSNGKYVWGGIEQDPNTSKQTLAIKVFDGSSYTRLQSYDLDSNSLENNTNYWLVTMIAGNVVRSELWKNDPTLSDSLRSAPVTALLPSGYNTRSKVGVSWVPKGSSAYIFSFEAGFAFASTVGGNTLTVQNNQHVDIRSMINETRYAPRPAVEFNAYHQTENAYSQTLRLDSEPVEGQFKLLFYQSDNNYFVPVESAPIDFDATADEIKQEVIDLVEQQYIYSYFNGDSIVSVTRPETGSCFPLTIEFNHFYGDLSLLRADLDPSGVSGLRDSTNAIPTSPVFDNATSLATFEPNAQDAFFIQTADPIDTELNQQSMQFLEDSVTENWRIYSAAGGLAPANHGGVPFISSDLAVGKNGNYGNQRVAEVKLYSTTNWSLSLQSSLPKKSINAKLYTDLTKSSINISFLNYNSALFDYATSYVQFTSNASGLFHDQGGETLDDSTKVYFTGKIIEDSGRADFRATMNLFSNTSPNARFDFGQITGVRIVLFAGTFNPSTPYDKIVIGGIRAIDTSINYRPLTVEINTRTQNVAVPMELADADAVSLPPMIRGTQFFFSEADDAPIEGEVQAIIQTTVEGPPQNLYVVPPASPLVYQTAFNRVQLYSRYVLNNTTSAEWLTSEFGFNNVRTYIKTFKTFRVRSAGGPQIGDIYWEIYPGEIYTELQESTTPDLISSLGRFAENTSYQLAANVSANSITVAIDLFDVFNRPVRRLFESVRRTDGTWTEKAGRVGWWAEFIEDVEMRSFDFAPTSYALLRTKVIETETPVDGAQLFTVDSGYVNVFEFLRPNRAEEFVELDPTKSISGSSYKLTGAGLGQYPGLISNQFDVDNWDHIFVEFDIWVPGDLATNNLTRPRFYLRPADFAFSDEANQSGLVGPITFSFVPNTWTPVSISLSKFSQYLTGNYKFIVASVLPHKTNIWIDNVKVKKQTVEWEIRTRRGGAWMPFRGMMNEQYAAIHFPPNQTGSELQLQARALTEDAWISEYTLVPRYAPLGRILYKDATIYLCEGKSQMGTSTQNDTPAGVWNSSTSYSIGNRVAYRTNTNVARNYIAIQAGTNQLPTNTAYWSPMEFVGEWSSSVAYNVGDIVADTPPTVGYPETYYVCIQNGTNKDPNTQPAYWTALSGYTESAGMATWDLLTATIIARAYVQEPEVRMARRPGRRPV